MSASSRIRLWETIALTAAFGALACQAEEEDPADGSGGSASEFVSARPKQVGGVGGAGGAGEYFARSTGGAPPDPDRGGVHGVPASAEPGDMLRNAPYGEIVQRVGDVLFVFSPFGGLAVVDASQPAALRVLGRVRFDATPVDAYLHDGTLFALVDDSNRYVLNADARDHEWVQTSRVLAFDVSDPDSPVIVSELELRGSITDSRLDGNWLHVVTDESGYCHGCGKTPDTYVSRVDIDNPSALRLAGERDYELLDSPFAVRARAVHLAPGRAYVSPVVATAAGAGDGIQVLDLSDSSGAIQEGGVVNPSGLSDEPWQVDEHAGVLRVVTQRASQWRTAGADLVVETFDAAGTSVLAPLGQASLPLSRGEKLAGVRFDGDRAFVTSQDRRDPIVVVDLSTPSDPRFGQIAVPDWTFFLEPRDGHLLVIGQEATDTSNGTLHASLYDVTDVLAPALVERVPFGGSGTLSADPKSFAGNFTLFADIGLLAVAYFGTSTDAPVGCARVENVVELFDFDWRSLSRRATLRGSSAPSRLFTHAAHLLVAADAELASFNLPTSGSPARTSSVALSRHVEATLALSGDRVVRIDPSGTMLDVTPADRASDPGTDPPFDVISEIAERDPAACDALYSPVLLHDDRSVYLTGSSPSGGSTAVGVMNVAGDSLELESTSVVQSARAPGEHGFHGYFIGLVPAGRDRVLVGSSVVVQRTAYVPEDETTPFRNTLEIFDAASSEEVQHTASVELPHALGPASLVASERHVLATRWIPEGRDPNLARFYLDRIDVTDPAHPELLPALPIPGSLVSYDPTSGTAVVASYDLEEASSSTGSCFEDLGLADSWFDAGVCFGIRHGLHLVRIDGTSVEILDTAPIEGAYGVVTLVTTGARSYFMLATHAGAFETLIADTTGNELTVTEVADAGSYYGFAASPNRLAFAENFYDPSITVLDTARTPPAVLLREPIRWDTVRSLSVTDNWVVGAFGQFGARSYPLGER